MEQKTFQFVASWLVIIAVLIAASKTRIGYTAIYYGLLLLILLVLLIEYKQVAPLLNPITLGELNSGGNQQITAPGNSNFGGGSGGNF